MLIEKKSLFNLNKKSIIDIDLNEVIYKIEYIFNILYLQFASVC